MITTKLNTWLSVRSFRKKKLSREPVGTQPICTIWPIVLYGLSSTCNLHWQKKRLAVEWVELFWTLWWIPRKEKTQISGLHSAYYKLLQTKNKLFGTAFRVWARTLGSSGGKGVVNAKIYKNKFQTFVRFLPGKTRRFSCAHIGRFTKS